jgi:hypothetical protein
VLAQIPGKIIDPVLSVDGERRAVQELHQLRILGGLELVGEITDGGSLLLPRRPPAGDRGVLL